MRHRILPGLALLAGLISFSPSASAARLQRWLYYSVNLWMDANVTNLENVLSRAAHAGYTHVLLSDSKFCRLQNMDPHYFANVSGVKATAAALGLELVPAVFPIGYSNDLLFNDPNLIEAMPVTNALLVVSNGLAVEQADPPVSFPSSGFTNLSLWDWHDATVTEDNGAASVANPNGQSARVVRTLHVAPFRQYHIAVRVKTQSFPGTPEIKVLTPNTLAGLTYNSLGVQPTQDWQTHHVVFNSLTNSEVLVYFSCWDGTTGMLWWEAPQIEEGAFLNLVRRPGAPLVVQVEGGPPLVEGKDFPAFKDPLMGTVPYNGIYDVYHPPPLLSVNATNGTRLRASWYHAVTVYDDQAMICPSEPATTNLLWDQARRVHALFGAKGYLMSHDEIRMMNWCGACQQRHLDAGAMLADNARTCIQILRTVNPGGAIYEGSDMFDPNHNAHANYYLVRGNLAGSWLGLDSDVIILPWYFDQRVASMSFFAGLGHRMVLAGYYDSTPDQIGQWLASAKPFPGILGGMYTTWRGYYGDLEAFSAVVSEFEIHNGWPLDVRGLPGGVQLEMPTLSGGAYSVLRSLDLAHWNAWTNFTATAAIARCFDATGGNSGHNFYRAVTSP